MPSVTFWIVLGCWVSVSATLYIRVLYVIKSAKNAMYDAFFFRQFFSQGLFDMTFFAVYIVFNTLPPSANLSLNGTILIRIQYLHTYYFLYAQVLGICLMSLNRLFIMNLTSRLSTFCEELPQILVFFIQLVVPFFLIVHCLFQPEPYYILQNENAVRVIAPESVMVNAAQAALTTSLACAVCAVSYALLLRKLLAYSKSIKTQSSARARYLHRETTLSMMGFTLFVALCVVTAFYVTILVGMLVNPNTYRFITFYYPHIIAFISFMNPWALTVTNASTRKRVFRTSAQNAVVYTASAF